MIDFESILSLAKMIKARAVSAEEIIEQSLRTIEAQQSALNAFRELYAEQALSAAREVDRRIVAGEHVGSLAGVPIAVKDNIATDFGRTSCGSRFLEAYRSPFNATVVERLLHAGAVIVGKTNCDEFAMGSSNEHCAFGPVRNPWDTTRVPGGSSGGAAAAVASGACAAAIGSDTGGSVRQPASMCGVTGLRPSYGRVSRHGLVAFASSLDQIGPIARTVECAAALLNVIAGADRLDATCPDMHVPDSLADLDVPIEKPRLGVPKQYHSSDNHPTVNGEFNEVIATFSDLGAEIIELDLPLTDVGVAAYYLIATAEASSNLARYDGVRFGRRAALEPGDNLDALYVRSRTEGFGPEVRRRIMLGTYALSAGYYDEYYLRALKVRRLIREEYARAFEHCDAILGPTSPVPAFPLGSKQDPLEMYQTDIYTVGASVAGLCAISIPCGFAQEGGASLPIGLQIQCPAFKEPTLFRLARMFESASTITTLRPPIFAPLDQTKP